MNSGCDREDRPRSQPVVLYCSVDEAFAREVVTRFEVRGGGRVQLVTDSEAGKTTGLVQRIRLERDRPRGDVFWSGEQSQTVMLAREGLLAKYVSPAAQDIPATYRDAEGLWTAIALRARVLAYDPQRSPAAELPRRWEELAEPRFAAVTALANPLFGTTRGHVAAMHAVWGPQRFGTFLEGLVEGGAKVVDGNSTAVRRLIEGDVDLALTDSDDVLVARRRGHRVEMTFPDLGDGGTMLIPNTVALLAGAEQAEQGRRLVDFLVSAEVEEMLARSESGNYPVRAELRAKLNMELPAASRLTIDRVVDAMPAALDACREVLLR